MNKLIFNDVGSWPHFFELCEFARSQKANGHNVYFLSSNDSIVGNPANPFCLPLVCLITRFRNNLIHKELNKFGINCFYIKKSKKSKEIDYKNKFSKNLLIQFMVLIANS